MKANPDKPWDWAGLSENPNITMEIVLANPDKPWDWEYLSYNPNITWEIIEDNLDKPWNWYWLSENLFKIEKNRFMNRKFQEHIATFRIQTRWRRANEDPEYELCRRRINREYNDLFEKVKS